VNEYLGEISGAEFTVKDFRIWGGRTCLATSFLLKKCAASSHKPSKAALVEVIKQVSAKLGNKPPPAKGTIYIPQYWVPTALVSLRP